VRQTLDRLSQVSAPVIGFVLNRFHPPRRVSGYSYTDGYRVAGGYGSRPAADGPELPAQSSQTTTKSVNA
jgi:hypothetical protein